MEINGYTIDLIEIIAKLVKFNTHVYRLWPADPEWQTFYIRYDPPVWNII